MLISRELLDRIASISDHLDNISDGDNKDTLSEKFEAAVSNIFSRLACFSQELNLIEAECSPLVDPSIFYLRAKEMYDSSKNFDHWGITKPDELTICFDDIRNLNTGAVPTRSEMEALAKRFAELIPAQYGLLINMHLK